MPESPRRRRVARTVARWRTEYALLTVFVWVLALPMTVWKFPDNSLWLALLITFGGLTAALADLADQLADEGEDL